MGKVEEVTMIPNEYQNIYNGPLCELPQRPLLSLDIKNRNVVIFEHIIAKKLVVQEDMELMVFYDDYILEFYKNDHSDIVPIFQYKLPLDNLISFTFENAYYLTLYEKLSDNTFQILRFNYIGKFKF